MDQLTLKPIKGLCSLIGMLDRGVRDAIKNNEKLSVAVLP